MLTAVFDGTQTDIIEGIILQCSLYDRFSPTFGRQIYLIVHYTLTRNKSLEVVII